MLTLLLRHHVGVSAHDANTSLARQTTSFRTSVCLFVRIHLQQSSLAWDGLDVAETGVQETKQETAAIHFSKNNTLLEVWNSLDTLF